MDRLFAIWFLKNRGCHDRHVPIMGGWMGPEGEFGGAGDSYEERTNNEPHEIFFFERHEITVARNDDDDNLISAGRRGRRQRL